MKSVFIFAWIFAIFLVGIIFYLLEYKHKQSIINFYKNNDSTEITAKLIYFYPNYPDTITIKVCKGDEVISSRGTNYLYCIKNNYNQNHINVHNEYSSTTPLKLIKENE